MSQLSYFCREKVPVNALGVDERVPRRIGRCCTDVIEVGDTLSWPDR